MPISRIAEPGRTLSDDNVADIVASACSPEDYRGKRILVIVPDSTRTAPVGMVFKQLFDHVGGTTAAFDIMVALGTHPPMSESAICERLDITETERRDTYRAVRFFNHAWDDPQALREIGILSSDDVRALTDDRFSMDVVVEINRQVFDYDQLIIIGPVFPHEVVGFSGGNKYLFPGVAGPRVLNFFHWLGAVVTNPMIIGNKWTPVRKVVDKAGSMVSVDKLCFCMVVEGAGMSGLFAGTMEDAWDKASDLSRERHIIFKDKPFHTILSCAPPMYDDLWVGGKCMYKLEPVLADGGELIIYAPHIRDVSFTHGETILELGYHCRDFILKQWDTYKDYPWGLLAHSAHVYGLGTYENGVETPRARVTLATGLSEPTCRRLNLGYRDPATLCPEDYANREAEGVLLVPKAGERLFQLKEPPAWAGGKD